MDLELTDKVAVVTGASKGIGLAVVRELAAEGAIVVAGARSVQALEGIDRVTPVAVDLAEAAGPARLIARAIELHGRIDVLVNNVGAVHPRLNGFLNLSDEDFQEIIEDVKDHNTDFKPTQNRMTLLEYTRQQADKGLELAEKEVTRLQGVLEDYRQRAAEYIKSLEDALEEAKLVHKTYKASVNMLTPTEVAEDKPTSLPPVSTLPAAGATPSSKKVTNGNK